jgi:hypothetical protein
MPAELHVQFRLPAAYAKRLKALADLHGTTHNHAARMLVIESLEGTLQADLLHQVAALQEELAAIRAAQREQAEELSRFHAEFHAALQKTVEKRG